MTDKIDTSTETVGAMLDEVEARAENATRGPWVRAGKYSITTEGDPRMSFGTYEAPKGVADELDRNLRFISRAREDVPRLVATCRALLEERDRASALCDKAVAAAGVTSDRLLEVEFERDRLARILAVERGDESVAPDGWRYRTDNLAPPRWQRDGETGYVWRNSYPELHREGWYVALTEATPGEWAPTAFEAMEAADKALRERGEE